MIKSTIIVGPCGSGKSTLALSMAKDKGVYVVAPFSYVKRDFGFSVLGPNPLLVKTVILEDCQFSKEDMFWLKELMTSNKIHYERKYRWPITVPLPNLIIVGVPSRPEIGLTDLPEYVDVINLKLPAEAP